MARITADYPEGGFRTRVSETPGVGLGGGGYGLGDMSWLMQLAKRRAQQQLRMGDFEYEMAQRAARERYGPKLGTWDSPQGAENIARRGAISQGRDVAALSRAQRMAAMRPAPTRTVTGAGVIPGPTLDPMAMSGIQRQLFLPQHSQEIGGPISDIERGAYGASRGQQRGDMAGIQEVMGMLSGSRPGFSPSAPAPTSYGGDPQDWFTPGRYASPGTAPTPRYGGRGGGGTLSARPSPPPSFFAGTPEPRRRRAGSLF